MSGADGDVATATARARQREGAGRDADATRRRILAAARAAFARSGLAGARVDAIAAEAGANKRMIYYYFDSKEGLFRAVLEEIYEGICASAATLDLDGDPAAALADYVDFVFRYYRDNPDVIAILNSENLHGGRHLEGDERLPEIERPFTERLGALLAAGARTGAFRQGLDPFVLHVTTVALAYFYLGNRATLSRFYGRDLAAPAETAAWRAHMLDVVRRTVAP